VLVVLIKRCRKKRKEARNSVEIHIHTDKQATVTSSLNGLDHIHQGPEEALKSQNDGASHS
jgi:hypothetical protein